MAKLAIKGHATRGKEVIEILEMVSGFNKWDYLGNRQLCIYYINSDAIINYTSTVKGYNLQVFTLEEFLEKYPYKLGDEVTHSDYESPLEIVGMKWENDSIKYEVYTNDYGYWFSVDELQPYKEQETMEHKEFYTIADFTKEPLADKVEIILGDYKLKEEDGKLYAVKESLKYPMTYKGCCDILISPYKSPCVGYKGDLIESFQKLLVCRDAYWKIAGEELGLGKPWEPDWKNDEQGRHMIMVYENKLHKDMSIVGTNFILVFPTEEIRDAFYENFKDLIEECKELL